MIIYSDVIFFSNYQYFKFHVYSQAKLRVYESRWSQSFSTDTVGSGGVVVCHDKERGKKYMVRNFITIKTLNRLMLH